SGSSIWHDNTWLGRNSGNGTHTALGYFREYGATGGIWGFADGENGWDSNDPHGVYFSGVSAGGTNGIFSTGTSMTPNAYAGMQVRNDHVGSPCFGKSANVISNTATTINYYFYSGGDRGAPLIFNHGDEFSIRKVLIGLDQNGRGKGVLKTANQPKFWPNEQQETCFSWNNKNTDTGQVVG